MRYMLETPWGRFTEDGSHFDFDFKKLGPDRGYNVEELKGVLHCYHHPRHETGHVSEATVVLVAAAMRRDA